MAIKQCILLLVACNVSFVQVKPVKQTMPWKWIRVDFPATLHWMRRRVDSLAFGTHQSDIQYALIVRWTSFGILWAYFVFYWMNLHFIRSLLLCLSKRILFSLFAIAKNMLIFNGNEFIIFGQAMKYELLRCGIRL